jgi:hypothetical protein
MGTRANGLFHSLTRRRFLRTAGSALLLVGVASTTVVGRITAAALSNKVTLPDTTSAAPALASALGKLFLGWTGTDLQRHLNVMSSANGSTFTSKVTLVDTSPHGPALAGSVIGQAQVALAWTGTDSTHHLNVTTSADGVTFGNKVGLGDTSVAGPGLAWLMELTIDWTGTDLAHLLNLEFSPGPGGRKTTFRETSIEGPVLAYANFLQAEPDLLIGWTGTDNRLNVMLFPFPGTPSKVTLAESSFHAPALAFFSSQGVVTVLLAWTGTDGRLNLMTSQNGRDFGNKVTLNETSSFGPALASFSNGFFIAWAGTDLKRHINVARVS